MGGEKRNDSGRKKSMEQRRNTLLLAGILAAVFLALSVFGKKPPQDAGLRAVIQVKGETVHTMELDQDAQYTVAGEDGHYNTVVVADGTVAVSEADCPNQICVKTAPIRFPGEVISCLPHRLIISIE